MRRVNFDYPNTCPQIDKAITRAKHEISSFIDDLLSDACGLLEAETRKALASDYADSLYLNLEDLFEDTRRTNEQMRDSADSQIADLKAEIEDLERKINELESMVE